jgi:hypothetical protein
MEAKTSGRKKSGPLAMETGLDGRGEGIIGLDL